MKIFPFSKFNGLHDINNTVVQDKRYLYNQLGLKILSPHENMLKVSYLYLEAKQYPCCSLTFKGLICNHPKLDTINGLQFKHIIFHNFYILNVRRNVLIEFSALEIRLGCRFLLYVYLAQSNLR